MKTVLFVDDDPYWSQNYQEQIAKKFSLIYKSSADGAIAELSTNINISLLVLDVMMDTPDSVDITVTEGGLITGIWLLEKIEDFIMKKGMPVIILTNRQKKLVIDAVKRLKFPPEQIIVFSKAEMSAKQLPVEIQKRLGR